MNTVRKVANDIYLSNFNKERFEVFYKDAEKNMIIDLRARDKIT